MNTYYAILIAIQSFVGGMNMVIFIDRYMDRIYDYRPPLIVSIVNILAVIIHIFKFSS